MLLAVDVIELFGGVQKFADAIGRDRTTVYRWTQPKQKRGTDGYVPTSAYADLFRAATDQGIDLDAWIAETNKTGKAKANG